MTASNVCGGFFWGVVLLRLSAIRVTGYLVPFGIVGFEICVAMELFVTLAVKAA